MGERSGAGTRTRARGGRRPERVAAAVAALAVALLAAACSPGPARPNASGQSTSTAVPASGAVSAPASPSAEPSPAANVTPPDADGRRRISLGTLHLGVRFPAAWAASESASDAPYPTITFRPDAGVGRVETLTIEFVPNPAGFSPQAIMTQKWKGVAQVTVGSVTVGAQSVPVVEVRTVRAQKGPAVNVYEAARSYGKYFVLLQVQATSLPAFDAVVPEARQALARIIATD